MTISLAGPTAAGTTTALTAATYTFLPDMANDNRTKVFYVSAVGGTQSGVTVHRGDKPKQWMIKRPAVIKTPSAYNQVSGRYGRVPKNVVRTIFKGAADIAANQPEPLLVTTDFSIPAGAPVYDRANVEACVLASIAALWDQKEEIIQAIYDNVY